MHHATRICAPGVLYGGCTPGGIPGWVGLGGITTVRSAAIGAHENDAVAVQLCEHLGHVHRHDDKRVALQPPVERRETDARLPAFLQEAQRFHDVATHATAAQCGERAGAVRG